MFLFLRSCLAVWAHVYVASATCPKWDAEQQQGNHQHQQQQQQHSICKNAARISIIECVVQLGVSISAKWCFQPVYVWVRPWYLQSLRLTVCQFLITITFFSRMYVAVSYRRNHGFASTNDAKETVAARTASSSIDVHEAGTSLASILGSQHEFPSYSSRLCPSKEVSSSGTNGW